MLCCLHKFVGHLAFKYNVAEYKYMVCVFILNIRCVSLWYVLFLILNELCFKFNRYKS